MIKFYCINRATILLSFLSLSCKPQNSKIEKIELQTVSVFADNDPPRSFTLTLEAKNDTTQKLIITIPIEEAVEPPIDFKDTIAKYKYQVKEIFIDSLTGNLYTAKIICASDSKLIRFRSRAIDAIKIGKRFGAPIFADKKLLHK